MKKKLAIVIFCFAWILAQPLTISACDKAQSDTYLRQILFGYEASKYENNKDVEILLDAVYLCSMQSDNQGQDKLDSLKRNHVSDVPKLSDINISSNELLECSHVLWGTGFTNQKAQTSRKKILRNAVEEVFEFGFREEVLNSNDGKSEAFIEFLYYTHILSDYIADSPSETKAILSNGEASSYAGNPYAQVSGNKPGFSNDQKTETETYYHYSTLDNYGRGGAAIACIGPDTLAEPDSRQSIGNTKPSGWNQSKYAGLIADPPYLFNRCHLIAHELGGVDEEKNLITGTRYLNIEGMLPFENKITEYVRSSGNHVIYRATPVYKGSNALATGVQLEAYSIEDHGKGICFNVFCYNVQPGVSINYMNGANEKSDHISDSKEALSFANGDYQTNPDFISLMDKTLEQLFSKSPNGQTYQHMKSDLNEIANKARTIDASSASGYLKLKEQEYRYLEVLKENIPELLKKEKFFQSAF